jgi:hypothetical protein
LLLGREHGRTIPLADIELHGLLPSYHPKFMGSRRDNAPN